MYRCFRSIRKQRPFLEYCQTRGRILPCGYLHGPSGLSFRSSGLPRIRRQHSTAIPLGSGKNIRNATLQNLSTHCLWKRRKTSVAPADGGTMPPAESILPAEENRTQRKKALNRRKTPRLRDDYTYSNLFLHMLDRLKPC